MVVGVLALQGDFAEHKAVLDALGLNNLFVRTTQELTQVDVLILPGGESTVMMKLLKAEGLDKAIQTAAQAGMPMFGTCAGAILLSRSHLGLVDMAIDRNAYGSQLQSFATSLDIERVGVVEAEFIRAPKIEDVGQEVEVLAEHQAAPVLVKQASLLAATFHTETTADARLHQYFVESVAQKSLLNAKN